ncbi:hypothetical protein PFICI_07047 [Pestalotiopsis fici W106-1]|uniref:Uncharacterized protein n=1 Tax=Pestalotiopsis fici (strain W106-1 / CGMCC3.15140) TaxID=1229662 RepID=W3X7L3_PESFW|nr:uncharacterized protein PFICI_07047 [Pestalotiopsis fici W106-1]ETS82045.1 hypothetical protein PFICI_07047 [Pestalotiopsis fici W106-1]
MSSIALESIYIYIPNKGAPVAFAVAFLIVAVVHAWQSTRYKAWKWTVLHPLCALMFAVGFAVREVGAFNYEVTRPNINIYITSTCFIYFAPPLLELANYHVLGRTLYYVHYLSPLHPGRVLTTFGFLSTLVEMLNGIGVSYSANSYLPQGYITAGHDLMRASLILQIVVIACFALLATVFYRRCQHAGVLNRRVKTPLQILYVSMGLILVRTIYRTVEYFDLSDASTASVTNVDELNPLLRNEWYFWVFEAAIMLINSCLWNVFHPGRYLPVDKNLYLDKDGVTEVLGDGVDDKRSWLMTLCDPFGLLNGPRGKRRPDGSRTMWMKLYDPFGWLESPRGNKSRMSPESYQNNAHSVV